LDKVMLPKGDRGLGFKDLHAFNMAMLAKQWWCLVSSRFLMCKRVMGAHYFPNGNVVLPMFSLRWRLWDLCYEKLVYEEIGAAK
jgi:hypothetical protein